MKEKIPFHVLAAALAEKAGISEKDADAFLKEFFGLISDTLTEGRSVKIKGFGQFDLTSDDEKVAFTPDAEIAEAINAPFALFEPEILHEGVTADMLESVTAEAEAQEEAEAEDTPVEASVEIPAEKSVEEPVEPVAAAPANVPFIIEEEEEPAENEPAEEPVAAPAAPQPEPVVEVPRHEISIDIPEDEEETVGEEKPAPVAAPVIVETEEETADARDEEPEQVAATGPGFGMGFFIGALTGIAVGALGVFLYVNTFGSTSTRTTDDYYDDEVDETELVATDTVVPAAELIPAETVADTVAPPAPVPEPSKAEEAKPAAPVTDVIKAGYLMPAMAKKHYGHKDFWVYIYEENKAKVGNPNRVNAGTTLVIPPASKYGINPDDPASIEKARALGAKILSKY